MRQAALYVEEMVINDPVFEFTSHRNKSSKASNAALEMQPASINREKLAKAALYVTQLQPALQAGFVTFSPISHLHEPPKHIPLLHSDNGFADVLPKEILDWFIAAAQVFPMRKPDDGKGWYVAIGEPLIPCRAIDIHFKGHPSMKEDAPYLFYESKSVSLDKTTNIAKIALTLPQEPPTEGRFNAWVSQSVNQASRRFFDRVSREVYEAGRVGATYLTRSPFVADLLGKAWPQVPDLQTDVLKGALGLELPYLDGIPLERVLDIRQQEGEAFHNFRVELEKQLRELRLVTDPHELTLKLQNISHELSEVQIHEIDKKVAKIKRAGKVDALVLGLGVITTLQTYGISLLAVLYAVINGAKTVSEYQSQVKESPAFFLWRLRKELWTWRPPIL